MRRMHAITGLVVLGALIATTPQPASGQRGDEKSPVEITLDARPGTEIRGDRLGEFLTESLSVRFGTDMRPLSVALRLEMISREAGVVERSESKPVEAEAGKTYPASTFLIRVRDRGLETPYELPSLCDSWRCDPDLRLRVLGMGTLSNPDLDLWDRRQEDTPRECQDATHAVRVSLVSDDERFYKPTPKHICLMAEG